MAASAWHCEPKWAGLESDRGPSTNLRTAPTGLDSGRDAGARNVYREPQPNPGGDQGLKSGGEPGRENANSEMRRADFGALPVKDRPSRTQQRRVSALIGATIPDGARSHQDF